jgi:hypothetical protein
MLNIWNGGQNIMKSYDDMTNDQLERECIRFSKEMNAKINEMHRIIHIREMKDGINGITPKDFLIVYDKDCDKYTFFIKKGRIAYDIYYDSRDKNTREYHSWWPTTDEENRADFFVPIEFSEERENGYSYDGSFDEAVETLKEYGFVDVRSCFPTEEYTEYDTD